MDWSGISGLNMGNSPYLRQLRDVTMQDALGQMMGARSAAMRSAGNDPSMAASMGLEGMLRGQGNASRLLGQGRLQWLKGQQDLWNQMRLMKYQQKLQQTNPLAGLLGGVGGAALGAWLGPGGWFAGAGD